MLLLALGLYLAASLLLWLQGYLLNGVVQRTVLRLRAEVEEKLNRLPLPYFDRQPRGELLSRVTNDIDNISQSLQQTLSQLLTSLLTVVGVLVMMFWISPLLALVALVTIPLSIVVTDARSPSGRSSSSSRSGRTPASSTARSRRPSPATTLVKVFGRQREVEAAFAEQERRAVPGQLRRPVHLRDHHAGDDVRREPELRGDRRGRRAAGGVRRR